MKRLISAILLIAFCALRLPAQNSATNKLNFHLSKASLADALQIYAELTDRTALHGPLPAASISLEGKDVTRAEGIAVIEEAFKKKHLTCIPDGKKFVLLVPDGEIVTAKALLAAKSSPKVESTPQVKPKPKDKNQFPSGTISIPQAPLEMAFGVYKQLVGATGFESNPALPPVSISLRTQTSLTRDEAIHAFEIVFGLNGILVERTSDNKIKATRYP